MEPTTAIFLSSCGTVAITELRLDHLGVKARDLAGLVRIGAYKLWSQRNTVAAQPAKSIFMDAAKAPPAQHVSVIISRRRCRGFGRNQCFSVSISLRLI